MSNAVTWETLSVLVAMFAAVIIGVAVTVWKICAAIAAIDHRLTALESRGPAPGKGAGRV